MESHSWTTALKLFEELLEVDDGEREARLTEVNDEVGQHVRELFAAHEDDQLALDPPRWPMPEQDPILPVRFEDFEVVRELGSGGMGRVYEAVQRQPRRHVALKVMSHGLTNEGAVQRFRLEAEILGRLDHPNIARIFAAGQGAPDSSDAGAADRPWIAMELVPGGHHLVSYASQHELSLDQRLEAFLKVCDGIQHGHQKGIIHRDIKPSNVLVDEAGEPKIIDFGIARVAKGLDLIQDRLTSAGELIGSLGAMAPEHLGSRSETLEADADTRTDVYSLGALLFELLTGEPSLDLREASLPEAIERARTRAPRPPSELLPTLPVELDWIVLRAMFPEPEGRYGSVAELSADLGRLQRNEPPLAGPVTRLYRARKFYQRNRAEVSAVAVVLALLVGTLAWVSSLYLEVDEQRGLAIERGQAAERERGLALESKELALAQRAEALRERNKAVAINAFMGSTLFAADPSFDGPEVRVVDILDRVFVTSESSFAEQPMVRAELLDTVGLIFMRLGRHADAERHFRESVAIYRGAEAHDQTVASLVTEQHRAWSLLELGAEPLETAALLRASYEGLVEARGPHALVTINARADLGTALSWSGLDDEAELHLRGALEDALAHHPEDLGERAHCSNELAGFLWAIGQLDEAEELLRWAMDHQVATTGPGHPDALTARKNYASLLLELARSDEAYDLLEAVHLDCNEHLGEQHRMTADYANSFGQALMATGQFERARDVFERSLESCRRNHGDADPLTLAAHFGLGTAGYFLKDLELAERELGQALAGFEDSLSPNDPRITTTRNNLAMLMQNAGRLDEAEVLLRANLEQRRADSTGINPSLLKSLNNLGYVLIQLERMPDARPLLEEAVEGSREILPVGHPSTLRSMLNLSTVYHALGELEAAIELLEEAAELAAGDPERNAVVLETAAERLGTLRELTSAGTTESDA